MIFLALLAPALCAGSWDWARYDRACTVDSRAFSGVRIQYERAVQLQPLAYEDKRIVLTRCNGGSVEYEFALPRNSTLFNCDIPVPGRNEQLRFARRRAYQRSPRLSYLPQTLLGAAFERSVSTDTWAPLSPLVADHWGTKYWTAASSNGTRLGVRTSLLRSPDVLEKNYPTSSAWTALVSPYEDEQPAAPAN